MITTADDLRCLRPSTGGGPDFIPQCIPGFGDTDRDRLCDAYDRCTDAPGTAIFRGQLTAVRTQDATAGNEVLTLAAKFHLPAGVAFGDLDPLADGASVVFFDTHGVILELPLPPGAFGGVGTAGWQLAGKTWRFLDRSAGGGAVTRLTLSDRGKGLPGGMVQPARHRPATARLRGGSRPRRPDRWRSGAVHAAGLPPARPLPSARLHDPLSHRIAGGSPTTRTS
jgi:hypothetical protein